TIEHAIVANQKMINSGTTGLHKTERGFGMEPTHHALWFADSNFTDIAKIGLIRKQDAANFERKIELARQPFRKLDFNQETGK
ncbi:MAG: peptidogalycan biosysnthesis protein, partial [Sneathiella sp.]